MRRLPPNKYQKIGLKGCIAINACKSIFGRLTEQIGVAEEANVAEGIMCLTNMCVPCQSDCGWSVFIWQQSTLVRNRSLSFASQRLCSFLLTDMNTLQLTFTALFGVSARMGGSIPLQKPNTLRREKINYNTSSSDDGHCQKTLVKFHVTFCLQLKTKPKC